MRRRQLGDRYGEAQTLTRLAEVLLNEQRPEEAGEESRAAVDIAGLLHDRRAQAEALEVLGRGLRAQGADDDALRAWREALDLFRVLGAEAGAARVAAQLRGR